MIRWQKLSLAFVGAGLALAVATGVADDEDTVTFANLVPGEEFAFIVDGKRGGEQINDVVYRQTSATSDLTVGIGNLQENEWNEITVYQKGRMVGIHSPTWTDDARDDYRVDLKDESAIDIVVYLISASGMAEYNRASWAAARAYEIWSNERMGLKLGVVTFVPKVTTRENILKFMCTSTDCKEGNDLKRAIGYESGKVNVYYVSEVNFGDGWATTNGVWCHNDMVVLGREARSDLLSHEFGHTFQLDHVSGSEFNETNVMWDLSVKRRFYTEGQLMRAYASENSSIIRTYNLVTAAHDCNDAKKCPGVEFRIWNDE